MNKKFCVFFIKVKQIMGSYKDLDEAQHVYVKMIKALINGDDFFVMPVSTLGKKSEK